MDRKQLKQAGKKLFKNDYWYSVLVAFLMALAGTSTASFNFSFNTSSSHDSSMDTLINSGEDFTTFFSELIQRPFAIVFFSVLFLSIVAAFLLHYLVFTSFRCGGIRYFLKSRKNQPVEIREVFENFKDKTNFNVAKVTFIRAISVILWTFLFIIPGIIKSFEYWAIDYILAVRPDIDEKEAKRLSKILMDGNKADLFVLELSFLGWRLLSVLTTSILYYLYINPYEQATFVEFFSDIRLQALAKGTITPNDIPDYETYNPFYQTPGDMPQYQPFTPPTYQQSWNNPYAPHSNPVQNNFYAPEQPVEPVVETPVAEPVAEKNVADPVIDPSTEEDTNAE